MSYSECKLRKRSSSASRKSKQAKNKGNSNQVKQVSLETLSQQIEAGDVKKLNIIVKADVHGSQEAIIASIEKLNTNEVSKSRYFTQELDKLQKMILA